MKVLTSIKGFMLRVWHSQFFKYSVVCIIGVLIVGFLDEKEFERDQAQIRELDKNPKAIEKIARERYFMKEDNEDIFILSDDDREAKPIVKTDESAE